MPDELKTMSDARTSRQLACTCARLRRTARQATRFYDVALRPVGLRLTQFSILANLERSEGLTVTRLSGLLGLERTTLTRNLKPLDTAGWVEIGKGQDNRSRKVALTPRGRAKLAEARPLWRSVEEDFRRAIGPQTAEQLIELLDGAFRDTPRA